MIGDVAQAFGLAGYTSGGGDYVGRAVDDEDLDWHDRAACRPELRPPGVTPAEWVGQFFSYDLDVQTEVIATICADCPVRDDCGREREDHGIWGGQPEPPQRKRGNRHGRSHPLGTRAEVMRLIRLGVRDQQIESQTRVPLRTIRYWRREAGIWLDTHGRVIERGQLIKESA